MNIKKLLVILCLTIIISDNSFSKEYNCKLSKTIPNLDFNKLPLTEVIIDIDFEKRAVQYLQMAGIQIYNLKFENNLATWAHTFVNPYSEKKRITYSYFDRSKKEFIQNTYPEKKNIKSEDLVLRTEFKCD